MERDGTRQWRGQIEEHPGYRGGYVAHLQTRKVSQEDIHGQAAESRVQENSPHDAEVPHQGEGIADGKQGAQEQLEGGQKG